MAKQGPSLEELQNEWKDIFQNLLPEAARSQSRTQLKWPVTLDHCFARIILDYTVGINIPWTSKVKSPAYENMSEEQLRASISLGRKILEGKADLVDLDNRSLELRGKRKKVGSRKRKRQEGDEAEQVAASANERTKFDGITRKREEGVEGDTTTAVTSEDGKQLELPPPSPEDSVPDEPSPYFALEPTPLSTTTKAKEEDLTPYLKKIALSHKTPFQKRVLSTLCQIPRGKYTTYAAISKHLSSSPRAVGNAVRNNPFAPQVPCHRVLASGGGIGGFHGSWGRNGEKGLNDDKKRKLLREEGVRFDGVGKVIGGIWEGFK